MNSVRRLLILASTLALSIAAPVQGLDTTQIDKALGRPGQKIGDVYKVGFPRTDLRVSVHGVAIKPGLALGSWAAFTGTNDKKGQSAWGVASAGFLLYPCCHHTEYIWAHACVAVAFG